MASAAKPIAYTIAGIRETRKCKTDMKQANAEKLVECA